VGVKTLSGEGNMRQIVLAMAAAACGATSQNPLSRPEDARPDPSLPGVWTVQVKGEMKQKQTVLVSVFSGGAWVEAVSVTHEEEAEGRAPHLEVSRCEAFPTVLRGRKYLNVRCSENNSLETPATAEFRILRYDVKKDTLRLRDIRDAPIEAAIRKGLLSARHEPLPGSSLYHEIHLTASSEQLARFVASADDAELFSPVPLVVMRRVALPPPLPAQRLAAQPSKKGP
jgi:hypothetical protein